MFVAEVDFRSGVLPYALLKGCKGNVITLCTQGVLAL